jgi:uncharacterized membrane protein YgcG
MMNKPLEEKWKLIQKHEEAMRRQENSAELKQAPEYYISVLRDSPTTSVIQELIKKLKSKSDDWIRKYLDLGGLPLIFEVLVTTSDAQGELLREQTALHRVQLEKKAAVAATSLPLPPPPGPPTSENGEEEEKNESDEEEKKDEPEEEEKDEETVAAEQEAAFMPKDKEDPFDLLQAECIKAIRTLMNTSFGMVAFLKADKSVEMMSRLLDSPNLKTKTQIFFLLATVTKYSEDGFWLTLDVMNHFKLMKHERIRFETLVKTLGYSKNMSEDYIAYQISCFLFINALIDSPQDGATKRQLKKEMRELKMMELIEKLRVADSDDTLAIQLGIFEEEMEEVEEVEAVEEDDQEDIMENMENPTEILKLIRVQLSGTDAFDHFVNILQYFLIISGKSSEEEKVENMKILESIVKKAITVSDDGTVTEISVRELQLSDRVMTQQKKIGDLEKNFLKMADMVKAGKIDKKMIDKFVGETSLSKQPKEMQDMEMDAETNEQVLASLSKMKKASAVDELAAANVPKEYQTHVRNLEAEVKYLTFKLKQAETAAKNGGGGGGGGSGSSGGGGMGGSGGSGTGNGGMGGSGGGFGGLPPPGPPGPPSLDSGSGGPPPPPTMDGGPPPPMMGGPPPPPMMGGPPPPPMMGGPPPPPMMGGPPPPPGIGGPPGPPIMGMMAHALPKLPNYKPSVPMKGIFWNKINNNKVASTVWMKKNLVQNQDGVKLDIEELEKLFAKKAASEKAASGPKKPEKITLIDPKKAQNSAIVLGSMRMDFKVVRKAILNMDEEKLSLENIVALKDMLPTADEAQAVKEYSGDADLLGPTEQFYKEIIDIDRLEQRMQCWIFKIKFGPSITNLAPDIENLTKACKEVLVSEKFIGLLEKILAVGNFLNSGKSVYGFEMGALNKLKDTKATGARIDLLRYIVLFVEKNYPDLLDFTAEMEHVEAATRVMTQNIQNELNELQSGLNQVIQEVDKADTENREDMFRLVMIEFMSDAQGRLVDEQENQQKLNVIINDLRDFYGEDMKKYKVEDFISNMWQFIQSWRETLADIQRKREMEEKKAAREAKKLLPKADSSSALKKKPALNKKSASEVVDATGDGIVDKTLVGLADGTGFKNTKAAARTKKSGGVVAKNRKKNDFDADALLQSMMKKEASKNN